MYAKRDRKTNYLSQQLTFHNEGNMNAFINYYKKFLLCCLNQTNMIKSHYHNY